MKPKLRLSELIGSGYRDFWNTKKRYRVVKGGRASKKSCTSALWFIYNMMKYYKKYGVKPCLLVIRRYFNTHKNSTRAQLIWAIKRLGVRGLWKIPKGEHTLTYIPSGQVILFRGMDDPESITSITVGEGYLAWCWIEEAYQLHDEVAFDKLDLSFRGEMPLLSINDPLFKDHDNKKITYSLSSRLFKQITLTFNPWSDTTWIKKRFFDNPDEDTFISTTDYTCNEFLGDDDKAIFEKMKVNNPRRFKVEGLGEWGIAEGLIYLYYADSPEKYHIKSIPEDEKKKIALITVGLDYGTGDGTGTGSEAKRGKTVLEATAITEGFSKIYCIDEAKFKADYLANEVSKWVIDFVVKLKEDYNVPIIIYAEWAGSKTLNNQILFDLVERKVTGVRLKNCFKSTILDRIDLSNILLGEQRIFFTDNVPGLKTAYKTALWNKEEQLKKGIPIRLDNGTTDIDSLDAHEYSISSYIKYLLAYTDKNVDEYNEKFKINNQEEN